jgi:hypothetical protein
LDADNLAHARSILYIFISNSLLAANEQKIYVDRIKKNCNHDLRSAALPGVAAATNCEWR